MQAALDELPEQYAERIANVDFIVARAPNRRERERLRLRGSLYGLYQGIPLPQRGGHYNEVLPDKITIFWVPLVHDFPDDGALADQVRKTVYHEIGHYFGLDEADLHGTSVQ